MSNTVDCINRYSCEMLEMLETSHMVGTREELKVPIGVDSQDQTVSFSLSI